MLSESAFAGGRGDCSSLLRQFLCTYPVACGLLTTGSQHLTNAGLYPLRRVTSHFCLGSELLCLLSLLLASQMGDVLCNLESLIPSAVKIYNQAWWLCAAVLHTRGVSVDDLQGIGWFLSSVKVPNDTCVLPGHACMELACACNSHQLNSRS